MLVVVADSYLEQLNQCGAQFYGYRSAKRTCNFHYQLGMMQSYKWFGFQPLDTKLMMTHRWARDMVDHF